MTEQRPSWPDTWMEFVKVIARRSYDPKYKVGAVIVSADNTRVLSLGYNGNAHGLPNERDSLETGKSGFIHAEENAYYKLDFHNPVAKVMYVMFSPCRACAKGAIQCNIDRVVYDRLYEPDPSGIDLMRSANIEVYSLAEANELARQNMWNGNSNEDAMARARMLAEPSIDPAVRECYGEIMDTIADLPDLSALRHE